MNGGLEIIKFESKNQFEKYMNGNERIIRFQLEQLISRDNADKESWYHYGYCECCMANTRLLIDWKYSNHEHVNFRERLVCEKCSLNNRQRLTFGRLKENLGPEPGKKVYLYEQVTPLYHQTKTQLIDCDVIGSEYLGFDKEPGETLDGIRHEDAMNLSFTDQFLDQIISNDVFEHVPDVEACFKEASRVLKPEGTLMFTIPFHHNNERTSRRCEIINGNLVHYQPEEYHGNPLDAEKGSLVFYNYGWDIVDMCKSNGFSECNVIMYYGYIYGYLGTNFIFVAKK